MLCVPASNISSRDIHAIFLSLKVIYLYIQEKNYKNLTESWDDTAKILR